MHYIIQENVFRETNYDKIFDALTRLGLSFEVVNCNTGDTDIKFATDRKDVFCFGSVRLAKLATQHGWKPGSFFGDNHDYSVYLRHYKENLLNYDCRIQTISQDIEWYYGEVKFIRPCKDSKAFNGQVFTKTKWEDLLEREKTNPNSIIVPDMLIQVGGVKTIYKEARVWIVAGKVVTSSYYRFNGSVANHEDVDPEGLEFAQEMANLYQVAEAFVMDICLTPDGWKIVEINCINCSGFYLGDLQKLLMALEEHFSPENYKTFEDYTDTELIAVASEFALDSHGEDSMLRKATMELYGNQDMMSMLGLGVPLSIELAKRLEKIVGKEMPNRYGFTKEIVKKLFDDTSDEEHYAIEAFNIAIIEHDTHTGISFHLDVDDYGIRTNSYIRVFVDGRVQVNLDEILEGGDFEDTFTKKIINFVNSQLETCQ